ncbi:hypothetical protein GCM10007874_00300 [Labrys miyagiensis]|uniref:Uncharacterized protein n=1 Tax=Labrys miyagiensis TaxID=346912 RepID=A0ABQ6CA82_9HYPH|nr:hypothetical protein GCM10007874_00300 [Labrys miyagiensis]
MLEVVKPVVLHVCDNPAPLEAIESVRARGRQNRDAPGVTGAKEVYRLIVRKPTEPSSNRHHRSAALEKANSKLALRNAD